jgi:hypothetical protein
MSRTPDNIQLIESVVVDLRRSLIGELSAALWQTAVKIGKAAPVLALLVVAYPSAGSALGTAEERAACTPDAFRLCSSAIPSADRVIACLKTEKAKLSTACRTVMQRNGAI